MSRDEQSGWFILRCAGRSTLVLAASLAEDGFEVWTPVRVARIRVPRKNVNREVKLPLLAAFVFVRALHLHDLLELEHMPVKPRRLPKDRERHSRPAHRPFSIFRHNDRIAFIEDRDLEPLRVGEIRAVPKRQARRFDRGERVRANGGVFQGMRGKVERSERGYALVIFEGGSKRWKIPTFLLDEDQAFNGAEHAKAA
jgi:transcription antitermination factor NusG